MNKHSLNLKLNKSLSFVLAILLVCVSVFPCLLQVNAAESKENFDFSGVESVVLYNVSDGISIIKHNSNKLLNTSTSAKIITGLILCERLENSLDEKVEITKEMLSSVSGKRANPPLQSGEIMSVRDLLYAAICGSYNDAAYVLAVYAAGGVAEFVTLMNQKAKSLLVSSGKSSHELAVKFTRKIYYIVDYESCQ